MADLKAEEFNAKWERSLREPETLIAPVQKVAGEIPLSEVLVALQGLADQAPGKSADHQELRGHIENLKKVLSRIDGKK
jgi:hypothetical protein